jgi:hypothetical protein
MLALAKLRIPLCLPACLILAATACDDELVVIDDLSAPSQAVAAIGESGPETCEEYNAARECGDGEGTQFCSGHPKVWGECLTDFTCMPGESRSCGLEEEFGDIQQACVVVDGVPQWSEFDCDTPLVLSFDGGPIEMAAETVASSASFDISGTGMCPSTDWPAARNPWLAIDLDKNGVIDAGHELFGSGSMLDSGRHAKHGFMALAQLDSDGDGKITPADERFAELLVWRDEDGDKQSQPWELTTLADEGVLSIELGFSVVERCDERGNCGRERARFEFADRSGRVQVGEVVDLYLACW